jgi:hypothetical protein
LLDILGWIHPEYVGVLKYPWFHNMTIEQHSETIELYFVNNLKEKVFVVLSAIISHTDPDFNLADSLHSLMRSIPSLSSNILH